MARCKCGKWISGDSVVSAVGSAIGEAGRLFDWGGRPLRGGSFQLGRPEGRKGRMVLQRQLLDFRPVARRCGETSQRIHEVDLVALTAAESADLVIADLHQLRQRWHEVVADALGLMGV